MIPFCIAFDMGRDFQMKISSFSPCSRRIDSRTHGAYTEDEEDNSSASLAGEDRRARNSQMELNLNKK